MTGQRMCWSVLILGLAGTGWLVQHWIGNAEQWSQLTSPQAVAHLGGLIFTLGGTVAGALGVDLKAFTKGT